MLAYCQASYLAQVYLLRLNFNFHYFPGWVVGWVGGWGGIEIKVNSAQLELELCL